MKASTSIEVNNGYETHMLQSVSAAVVFKKGNFENPIIDSIPTVSNDIIFWGFDNILPQMIYNRAMRNTLIPATLDFKSQALQGEKIIYGINEIIENKEVFKRVVIPEIEAWLMRSNFYMNYLVRATLNYYWFGISFSEIVLSKDRTMVTGVKTHDSMNCRLSSQNQKTGIIENCFISANWLIDRFGADATVLPMIDTEMNGVEKVLNDSKFSYIYPTKKYTPYSIAYPIPAWYSVFFSEWLSVAENIPIYKNAVFQNQLSIKYVLEVADWYWEEAYPGFNSMQPDEQVAIKDNTLEKIESFLKGAPNAGKSIMSATKTGMDGKIMQAWKLTDLQNNMGDGDYLKDLEAVSANILWALNIDPGLVGNAPSSSMGAGSGSPKRVSYNIFIENIKSDAINMMQILNNFIKIYNGWPPELIFKIQGSKITRLDVDEGGAEPAIL